MNVKGNVLVAQGGGPTAVINQSLAGIILEAKKCITINKIYGALRGIRGIVNEDFIDLTYEPADSIEQVAKTPSSALLSTRDKPDKLYCKEIIKVFKEYNIRYFFYIGGNDTADTLNLVKEEAENEKYDLVCIHVPKTIDNDLMLNDHTPGYASAARFVVSAFVGANLDNRALSGIYIGVVMGRNSGFLTAASSYARNFEEDGPHLIYLPEKPFSIRKFIHDVKFVYNKYGRCVIAVSEGLKDKKGNLLVTKETGIEDVDSHGNIQLSGTGALGDYLNLCIKNNLKIKRVRSDTFGYNQRSFFGCVSDVDRNEAREVGKRAVQFAAQGNMSGSVVIQRTGEYSVEYKLVNIDLVAGKTRYMPSKFISADENDVTPDFMTYISPLIGDGFKINYKFKGPRVEKH